MSKLLPAIIVSIASMTGIANATQSFDEVYDASESLMNSMFEFSVAGGGEFSRSEMMPIVGCSIGYMGGTLEPEEFIKLSTLSALLVEAGNLQEDEISDWFAENIESRGYTFDDISWSETLLNKMLADAEPFCLMLDVQ